MSNYIRVKYTAWGIAIAAIIIVGVASVVFAEASQFADTIIEAIRTWP